MNIVRNIFSRLFIMVAVMLFLPASALALTLDATGGDCPSIGTWDTLAQTCTLTQNTSGAFVINADNITLAGAGYTLAGTATTTGVTASNRRNLTVKNLNLSGFQTGMEFFAIHSSTIEGNTIITGNRTSDIGLGLYGNTTHVIVKNNLILGEGYAGISGGDADSDTFIGNTIKDFQTGLHFEYCAIGHIFEGNTVEGNTLGAFFAGSSGTFTRNNFKNNGLDIQNGFTGCGNGTETLSKPLPIGGNYWSMNTVCVDGNHDNICDASYAVATSTSNTIPRVPVTFFDNFPWISENGWNLPTTSPITLATPAETEDDGNQDAKGVADKTNFTFGISYTGATVPSDVTLWTNDGTITNQYPLSQRLDLWEVTRTFPKGHYTYHFEANGGAQRFPASGELGFTTGYSNVAFLPGLEASRLYAQGTFFENQLWFPNTQEDVRKLALSPTTGESVNPNVYTRDVIDEVAGTVNIYKTFLARLEGMVTAGDIEKAVTFPYDWRKDQKDTATQFVSIGPSDEFYSMIQRIEDMASSSPTGKVTLVTHSNGGLVAKELTEILRVQGKANILDRIIMVAAPQLGTPKAILETLHGSDFVLNHPNAEVTRELAENMKSAYTLLPSREYFNRLGAPIRPLVEFSTTTPATQDLRTIYGDSISDYDTMRKFLRGENGARLEPIPSDTNTPNVLKENFFQNAETRHAFQDSWTPPVGVGLIQIIGWGLNTPRGVKYTGRPNPPCVGFTNCKPKDLIDPEPLTTIEGDGTVVYSSAEAMDGEKYWVDVFGYNEENIFLPEYFGRDHKNILEVTPIQDLIATLIKNGATSTLPDFISSAKPPVTNDDQRLRIGVHSPVVLHLYDSLGRHTGLAQNPDLTSDFGISEEQIPNSYYWQIGEGQYAGADGATTTVIELKGTDTGTFTLDIENIIGDVTATTTTYEDIPVTASTTARIEVGATTATPLLLDIDGDGETDASITAGGLTAEDLIGILKGLVKTLHLPTEKERKLIKKIEKLEKELQKEHKNERKEKHKTKRAFTELVKVVKKFEKKNLLSSEEARELINIIEQIKNSVVK